MGYMGFGMRKENYQGKTVDAFSKLKMLYGKDTVKTRHDPSAPKLTTEEVLNPPRYKSIHDYKFYQIFKLITMSAIIAAFLYYFYV